MPNRVSYTQAVRSKPEGFARPNPAHSAGLLRLFTLHNIDTILEHVRGIVEPIVASGTEAGTRVLGKFDSVGVQLPDTANGYVSVGDDYRTEITDQMTALIVTEYTRTGSSSSSSQG